MNPSNFIARVFKVWKGTASQDERGGREFTVGYYFNRFDADEDVKGQGFWGSDGRVQSQQIEVVEVEVNGEKMIFPLQSRIEVFYENRKKREAELERNRKNGLAKLTKEERLALGLE